MEKTRLKKSLIEIAEKVNDKTTVEDIYNRLAFLLDIEESEEQERNGKVFSQSQVEKMSKKWLK